MLTENLKNLSKLRLVNSFLSMVNKNTNINSWGYWFWKPQTMWFGMVLMDICSTCKCRWSWSLSIVNIDECKQPFHQTMLDSETRGDVSPRDFGQQSVYRATLGYWPSNSRGLLWFNYTKYVYRLVYRYFNGLHIFLFQII